MNERKNLIASLIKFQKSAPAIPKNKVNPFFSNATKKAMYADLAIIIEKCMPVLNENDLAISQSITTNYETSKNILVTCLYHSSGEFLQSSIFLPDISDAQKLTAAITYLKRTQYISILGLTADDDDDGNGLSDNKLPDGASASTSVSLPKNNTGNATQNTFSINEPKPIADYQVKVINAICKKYGIKDPQIKTMNEAKAWIDQKNSENKQ